MTRRLLLLVSLAAVLAVAATGAIVLTGTSGPPTLAQQPTPTLTSPPPVNPLVVGAKGTVVPWQQPLSLTIDSGTILSVSALGPDGLELSGSLTPQRWTGDTTLIPGQPYQLRAVIKTADGETTTIERLLTASAPASVLHATITPEGGVYGVGQPVIVRFDKKVKGAAARAAVLQRLQVVTTPAVEGAWRWYNSYEVHYRGPVYWKPGTTIRTTATLAGLRLPGTDTWGAPDPVHRSFAIGRSLIGTVDITAHTMTVRRDGKVVKVFKVSTGRAKYPTKGGVHIVLVREREHLYNSATVGIPTASPGGYYEKLPWSVRISNGGAFVHANPATVRYQGSRNVSHGCVNMSVADAHWFYDNSKLGDVVNVIHAVVGPVRSDAGMSDWNYDWQIWKAGNLDG
jgi:lipoprotein-anchoring transpeptidase ErfK/SrfK